MVQTLYLGGTAFSNVTVGSTTVTAVYVGSTKIWEAGVSWTDPDLANASYDSVSFSVSSEDINPSGVWLSTDGTTMYMLGYSNDKIFEYSLSTAWDLSTASYSSVSFSVASQETIPESLFFKDDGLTMYVTGRGTDNVYQYSLTTAWDISTASYASKSFSVQSQEGAPKGVHFKSDGTKMYVVGSALDTVYQYSLSTAWDVSTASYDSVSLSVSSQDSAPAEIRFNPDGTKMYILGSGTNDNVFQYTLSTAWDLSTASYDSVSFSVNSQDTGPTSFIFKTDGSKLYMVGRSSDTVYQYST